MKILIFFFSALLFSCFNQDRQCGKLSSGIYSVNFTDKRYTNYKLAIFDSTFIQYFNDGDSVRGKIKWLNNCIFRMDYEKNDIVTGPLKIIYNSWGKPCIEVKESKKDTIWFRTTHPENLHITVNEGYFVKLK